VGYQLVFWKQSDDAAPAVDTYQALMNETPTRGLRPLPLPSILGALAHEFPNMDPAPAADRPCPVFWEGDDGLTVVEFSWSDVHVSAELRPAGFWSEEVANRVIDVLAGFDCPLYDPQTNERFDPSAGC
jgi:hypothetical protein